MSLKNIDDRFTFVKNTFNNKIIYGINNESLNNLKKEFGINEEIKKYGKKTQEEENNQIKIIGWNALSIYSKHNNFLINKYLDEKKPDFLMINELGSSKSNMDLHEDYKLIENSDYTGLIYSSKYRVQKILLNISDKYTFICKVDIKRNDKQFIIVIVYAHLMSLMK